MTNRDAIVQLNVIATDITGALAMTTDNRIIQMLQMKMDAIDKGIQALEKQEPKKPIKRYFESDLVNYECSNCGEVLGLKQCDGVIRKYKAYCRCCGQAIDWSE